MKEEEFEYPIPIESGQGIPVVLAVCVLLLSLAGGLVYGAWISQNSIVQSIVAVLFIYIIAILTYRMTETKQDVPVPEFKGWEVHDRDVDKVVSDFQEFLKNRLPDEKASIYRFKHGSHESNRTIEAKYKEKTFKINTSTLDQVIAFDKEKNLLHVEPGVPMDELALIAMAHGVIPQVVPEFPGITLGGAIGGLAGESTGHKYGLFHNTIEDLDVITGDGILHKQVSRTNKSDLFMAVCCSYGTQGILVRASVRVIPAPKYVKVNYYHEPSIEKGMDRLEALANRPDPPEFLDAVALTPTSVMIVSGTPVEAKPEGASQLHLRNARSDPWFFWYLSDLSKKKSISPDYMELDDFLFRFDRGAFWAGRHGMMLFHGGLAFSLGEQSGPHPLLRYLWNWLGTTRELYKFCHAPGDKLLAETFIIQDFILPTKENVSSLIQFNLEAGYNIWPLWICPIRKVEENHKKEIGLGILRDPKKGDLLYNVGMYGPYNGGRQMNPLQKNKELEAKVKELGGKKWLYAQSFYTEEEFWSHFHKEHYDELRKTYSNDSVFFNITSKVLLSDKIKSEVCQECKLNTWNFAYKLVPFFVQMVLELTTPRIVQPFFGIHHTEFKRYVKTGV